MATILSNKRIVYWKVRVHQMDIWSEIMQDVISSMQVVYEVGKPATATIDIISVSYIEDVFTVGTQVDIYFGYSPLDLVHMITGKIMKNPSGDAGDVLSYAVEIIGNIPLETLTMEKNRVFQIHQKDFIIAQIAFENGMLADIFIEDGAKLDKNSLAMQKAKTDYECLDECAQRWGCVWWVTFDDVTGLYELHFYDAKLAYAKGDLLKKPNLDDSKLVYDLGYRTDIAHNNVAKVAWSFDNKRNGAPGTVSLGEFGETEKPDDWVISFRGDRWELKQEWMDLAKKKPSYWGAYLKDAIVKGVGDVESTVRKYFRQCSFSKNQQDSYNNEPIKVTVDLNWGDPYLRPPRTAALLSGSLDPKAVQAFLPNFIYEGDKQLSSWFRMKKVTTSLNAGKLDTQIELTRNISGEL